MGRAPSQARVHFCAPPQARSRGAQGHRCPHTSSASAHTWTAPGAWPRLPADTSVVGHACSGARPSGQELPAAGGKLGRTQRGPWRSSAEPRERGAAAPPDAPPAPRSCCALSRFLSLAPSLPGSFFSRSSSGRLFLLLEPRRGPDFPLGRTCSQRRSRMRWGALRARASRPPQQPPGLAGSRMLRPPRAPLAVPRSPHRPHGGRLSQPEALQQGSTEAEKETERQGQPTGGGRGGGARAGGRAPPAPRGRFACGLAWGTLDLCARLPVPGRLCDAARSGFLPPASGPPLLGAAEGIWECGLVGRGRPSPRV